MFGIAVLLTLAFWIIYLLDFRKWRSTYLRLSGIRAVLAIAPLLLVNFIACGITLSQDPSSQSSVERGRREGQAASSGAPAPTLTPSLPAPAVTPVPTIVLVYAPTPAGGAAPAATATAAPPAPTPTIARFTPTPTPTPTPGPLAFSGSGQSVAGPFPLKAGLARIAMSHSGTRNFIVTLMDSDGKPAGGAFGLQSLLANQIGAWEGEKAVRIEKTGSYLMDITASGPWKITITQ